MPTVNEVLGAMFIVAVLLTLLHFGKRVKPKDRGQAFVVYWNRASSSQFNVPVAGFHHAQQFVNTLNLSTVCGVSFVDANRNVTLLDVNGTWVNGVN